MLASFHARRAWLQERNSQALHGEFSLRVHTACDMLPRYGNDETEVGQSCDEVVYPLRGGERGGWEGVGVDAEGVRYRFGRCAGTGVCREDIAAFPFRCGDADFYRDDDGLHRGDHPEFPDLLLL